MTAEMAMALPALAVILALAIWLVAAAAAQIRVIDAARDGARAAARGETDVVALAAARAAAPPGADVTVAREGDHIVVVVRARVGPGSGPLSRIPAPVAAATAQAQLEGAP